MVKKEYLIKIKENDRRGPHNSGSIKENRIAKNLFDYFKKNIDDIVLCKPEDLVNEEKYDFKRICGNKSSKAFSIFRDYMVGQYEKFIDKNGYWLSKKLNVNICPYCNRQYINTIEKGENQKGVRPQFDHFLPKSEYPYFALSFYNLIPSCSICNSTKKENLIKINPYEKGFGTDCKFHIDKIEKCILKQDSEQWKIILPKHGDYKSHDEAFNLNDSYKNHKDIVEEIVFKAQAYNEDYFYDLIKSFAKFGLTEAEIKCMIFGNYISPDDYGKRPLSKLTADILEQCGIKL